MLDTINKISYCGICHGKMMMAIEEEAAKAQSASTSTTALTEASTEAPTTTQAPTIISGTGGPTSGHVGFDEGH